MDWGELEKVVAWLTIGSAGFIYALIGSHLVFGTTLFRKKIKSQEELTHIVDIEARKLDLDPSKIDVKYNVSKDDYGIEKCGRYELHIKGDWNSNVAAVRHELYHILKDCDKLAGRKVPFFYYWFVAEPRATLYEWFSLRL